MARKSKNSAGNIGGMSGDPESLASGESGTIGEDKGSAGKNESGEIGETAGSGETGETAGSGETGAAETPRKRGRPKGSKNKTAGSPTQKTPIDLNGLEKLLYSLHAVAAVKIAPELALSEIEAAQLAGAISAVSEHYDFNIDPKTQAWVQLIICAGAIYAPRALRIRERVTKKHVDNVVPLHAPT